MAPCQCGMIDNLILRNNVKEVMLWMKYIMKYMSNIKDTASCIQFCRAQRDVSACYLLGVNLNKLVQNSQGHISHL